MIKILAHYPNMLDATSWYRGIGVMSNLYKINSEIKTEMTSVVHWSVLKGYDILFVQRPYLNEHVAMIQIAKKCNMPVWVDYDDLLTHVPSHNPFLSVVKKQHGLTKENIKQNVLKILTLSDVLTVSTRTLKQKLEELAKENNVEIDIRHIPNAHDDYFWPSKSTLERSNTKTIFWRGSESHRRDLESYENELTEVIKKYPDWKFYFMGYNPKYLYANKNVQFIPGVKCPFKYFETIEVLNPTIVIAPLEDNDFNRCKSNIAALEAIRVGAVCIAPDFDDWGKVASVYPSKEYFVPTLEDMIDKEDYRKTQAKLKRMTLEKDYKLSEINQNRVNIARELMGERR